MQNPQCKYHRMHMRFSVEPTCVVAVQCWKDCGFATVQCQRKISSVREAGSFAEQINLLKQSFGHGQMDRKTEQL